MGAVVGAQSIPPSVAALHLASAALLSQVRALDALPRIGSLRTLDLRGNELRVSFLRFPKELIWLFEHVLTRTLVCSLISLTSHKYSSEIACSKP